MKKLKDFITTHPWFVGTFLMLTAIRVWYVLLPTTPWWDTSVYIGIGKYIFTGGHVGLWEPFRPLLWPIIQGGVWKIGINPLVFGMIFVFLASVGALLLTYLLGNKMKEKSGVISMVLLGLTPVFFSFTNVQITDISSMALCLIAILFFSRASYFYAGLFAGIAFAFRFPAGLVILPLGLSILILAFEERVNLAYLKKVCIGVLRLSLGFLCIILPYLVFNYVAFHDIVLPFKLATQILGGSGSMYDLGPLFYIKNIFAQNLFSVFAIVGVVMVLLTFKTSRKNSTVVPVVLSLIFFFVYFTWQPHKELRYSIAFLPYLFLMAGYALTVISNRLPKQFSAAVPVVCTVIIFSFVYTSRSQVYNLIPSTESKAYDTYFIDKGYQRIIATSPMQVASADIKIDELFDTWKNAEDALVRRSGSIDYVSIDTSLISCDVAVESCDIEKEAFLKKLGEMGTEEYTATLSNNRELYIYHLQK